MESFRWDTCFLTGLAKVDEQHHQLVDVINRFGELLTRQEGAATDEIERVFSELASYAEFHFREEEELMLQSHIDPRYFAKHRNKHTMFLQEVKQMHAGGISGKNRDAASSLLNFLTNWLAYHILGTDQDMARQMSAIAAGVKPEDAYLATPNDQDPATTMLLHALNGLFHQVSDRNRELFELNQTLEARVAERTQELSEANQRLEDMAMTDVLTGLPNRRHALRIFEREWQESLNHNTSLTCMMIDADGFKTINDTYGHDAGDEVLRQLARQLLHAVRTDDFVCRLGGDEFLVICAGTPLEGAMHKAEKLRKEVASLRVTAGDGVWKGSISVGVAVRDNSMKCVEELLKVADEGVYVAKRNGRNQVATICSST